MLNPQLYSKYHSLQTADVQYVLQNYVRSINWNRCDAVLDIGSGSGEVTMELLAPLLPENFTKLVGLDISPEMVKLAKSKNQDPRVDFVVSDISSKDVTDKIREKFNHIFSFFCFHWVQDQRQAIRNIYNLLKPDGDVLLVFIARTPVYQIYETMASNPKWSKFLENTKNYISPYYHCDDPKSVFENMLLEEGFNVKMCQVVERTCDFSSLSVLSNSFLAVNPLIHKIPENMKNDYENDYVKEIYNLKYFQRLDNQELVFKVPNNIFIVLANKS